MAQEGDRSVEFVTSEWSDSFHMAFVDTFRFTWIFARVKPN